METLLTVIKRDGREVSFDSDRMKHAIKNAYKDVYGNMDSLNEEAIESLSILASKELSERFNNEVKIYEIQSVIEHFLLEHGEPEVAKAYIDYRVSKDLEREKTTNISHLIQKLNDKDKTLINENANKDSRLFHTLRDLTAGSVAKAVGLTMLPPHVANAHQKGDIHYHDLDYHPYAPLTNCCLIDFKGMLNNGFKLGNAEVESPNSIQTATAQIAQIVANVTSNQYGGCSVDRIDELLEPYAEINYFKQLKKDIKLTLDLKDLDLNEKEIETLAKQLFILNEDEIITEALNLKEIKVIIKNSKKKVEKEIYDSIQSLEYEIQTLFSANGQTPFFTVGFGLGTNWINREIQKAILNVRIKGIGKERKTAIFPKLVFTLKEGTNLKETDPNYDIKQLAIECSTKRIYPDILSYDKVIELTGNFKVPMGCRSFLQGWENSDGEEINNGRMNLGVVTLNLPRIAIESKGNKKRFWKLLNDRLEIIHDALAYRISRCSEAKPENAPIMYMNGVFGERLNSSDNVSKLFENGRSTVSVGYIGLYEVATVFYGGEWETNSEAKEFTLDILKHMNIKAKEWKAKEGYHYSVYGTPSESLTDRFSRMDLEKFGSIKDITDKSFYTNSFHYDTRKNPSPFEKIDFEKDYPQYASGGFIHYTELPSLRKNPKALEAIWDYAYTKVGYFGNNMPIDKCFECSFEGEFTSTEEGYECPNCGNNDPNTADVVRRLCGYLGSPLLRPAISGRKKEISSRLKHME